MLVSYLYIFLLVNKNHWSKPLIIEHVLLFREFTPTQFIYLKYRGRACAPACSVGVGEAWSLGWEWGSLASVESRAPSASFAHSGTSAFPGLSALLGTLPVVGLGEGAVVIVWSGGLVGSPVTLVEHLGVVEVEEVELISLGIDGWDGSDESGNNSEGSLHFSLIIYYINECENL